MLIASHLGATAEVDVRDLVRRRLTLTGSTLRPRTVEQKAVIAAALARDVWPLFESGQLRTYLYRTFPLAEASAAHALMESSTHIGKIVLEVRGQ